MALVGAMQRRGQAQRGRGLDGRLDLECLDRIHLNGYVPNLQVAGQVVSFMTQHLGNPIPSPAIMEKMGTAFRRSVTLFAETNHIPVVRSTRVTARSTP